MKPDEHWKGSEMRRWVNWEEWTGFAFHLRRRLSIREAAEVGPVIDVRGTDEAGRRLGAIWRFVPDEYAAWAREEIEPSQKKA